VQQEKPELFSASEEEKIDENVQLTQYFAQINIVCLLSTRGYTFCCYSSKHVD